MCHHHWPGNGVDHLKADMRSREFTARLASDECHYVLRTSDLFNVISNNPYKEKWDREARIFGERPAELAKDDSAYNQCHAGRGAHIHSFGDLYRFETTSMYHVKYIEVAVTNCNCHVMFPVELACRLFTRAATPEKPNGVAETGKTELAAWYENAREWEEGRRAMSPLWWDEAKGLGEERLSSY